MARTINAATLTSLQSDGFRLCHLIDINLGTQLYLTDNAFDVSYNSNTYSAESYVLGIGGSNESTDLRVGSITLNLSTVGSTVRGYLLSNDIINREAQFYKAVINDSTGAIVGDPIPTFKGYITKFSISDSGSKSSASISIASHWADFEKKNGRFTNDNSQQNVFSGDLGMQYAANTVKNLRWGAS